MDIELLNVRIFISKNTVVTDAIGNHRNEWQPFYTCYATVSGEAGKEQTDAGMVVDDSSIDFTIRCCDGTAERVCRIGHGGHEGSSEKGRYDCPEGHRGQRSEGYRGLC